MKARERFDKILLSCCERIQEEVASLIGKPFKLGDPEFRESSKEALFAEAGSKRVLAHILIDGDLQGAACMLVGIKDAIQIGGALIMLPESELASLTAEEQYSEELQDSFGEVANIFCGAITVTFEEQYPKKVRFIRTEQEVVVPVKVVVESEQPIADGSYYLMTVLMQLDNRDLGSLDVVFPAALFGLASEAAIETAPPVEAAAVKVAEPVAKEAQSQETVGAIEGNASDVKAIEEAGILERPVAVAPGLVVTSPRDLEKQQKLVDTLLKNSMAKMCEEVSALLGGTLQVVPTEHAAFTKAGFLEQAGGKQIMARMDIRGEGQGEAFLFVDVKTAVYLGGSLIMLPEGELEATVRSEDFSDDASDAYGEVTNIIAGVYTAVFEEQYRTKLGFVKTTMEPVTPVKVDPDSDEVLPNQPYYLSAGTIQYNGKDLGRLQLILPARVLELEDLLRPDAEENAADEAERQALPTPTTGKGAGQSSAEPVRLQGIPSESADILIFTDDDAEGGRIAATLQQLGYVTRMLHFKDSVGSLLTPRIQMIFLVMQEVSEQGFGVAIKISGAGLSVPLVAAGPAWTRTLVLKAVKYGACDILITPAAPVDVQEKIAFNLVKRAA